ncbi:hypothetical protein FRX31_006434 [Thalictrum thalictroides]|uniref:Uncharacterized protein n=1 Tax=Thalictrum thalictroides TaxID=46969 RepID=A0A7J6X2J5_THATH|nr:hypothetical protein FRX31_006434 [Thalictrum thalictroides]
MEKPSSRVVHPAAASLVFEVLSSIPKYQSSGKKRSHSGAVKVAPPPQLDLFSNLSKAAPTYDGRSSGKKTIDQVGKGKEIAQVFMPEPFVYVTGSNRASSSVN